MSWEREPLWSKARLFFQRAFEQSREDPLFGLWCSFGLELLARAAVASISPTLLAEPDKDQKNLLFALKRGGKGSPQSVGTVRVFALCRALFSNFSEEDLTASLALINRRNEEIHTGTAAVDAYPPKLWLSGFYRASQSLAAALGESLDTLFGSDEAKLASEILDEAKGELKHRVESTIAAHRKVFDEKRDDEKKAAAKCADEQALLLAHEHYHRTECPACHCTGLVEGKLFGPARVTNEDDEIVVRRSVRPRRFHCSACALKLEGYGELQIANLADHYTRKTQYSPEEYYGLVDPESLNLAEIVSEYLSDNPDFIADYLGANDYDNE